MPFLKSSFIIGQQNPRLWHRGVVFGFAAVAYRWTVQGLALVIKFIMAIRLFIRGVNNGFIVEFFAHLGCAFLLGGWSRRVFQTDTSQDSSRLQGVCLIKHV